MAKIVFGRESAPSHSCGVGVVNDKLAGELETQGHEAFYVYPCCRGVETPKNVFQTNIIPLTGKHHFTMFPSLDPIGQWKLRRWLSTVNPAVVHCNGTQQTSDQLVMAVRWCRKVLRRTIRLVLQIHTDEESYIKIYTPRWVPGLTKLALRFQAKRSRWLAESADEVVAPTKVAADNLRRFTGFKGKITIIPSQAKIIALMDDKTKQVFSDKLRTRRVAVGRRQWPLISVIGRVSPVKNLEFTIRVFARIIEVLRVNPAKNFQLPVLIFVGEPEGRKIKRRLEKLVDELGLKTLISFAGHFPYSDTAGVHQVSVIELILSLTETQGMAVVESMAYGAVPIVIKGTAPDEVLGNSDLSCQLDIDEIARLVIRVLDDEEFRTLMMNSNRERSLQYRDEEAYVASWLRVYDLAV